MAEVRVDELAPRRGELIGERVGELIGELMPEMAWESVAELIAELKELPADEIDAQVKFYKEAVTFEDKKFEELLKGLQAQYEEAKKAADKEKAAHKRKIKVLKALAKAKAPDAEL